MIAAGLGGRRNVDPDDLEYALHQALDRFHIPLERLDAVATEESKAGEPSFIELAQRLSLKLVACSKADLDRVSGQVLTPSQFVLATKRVVSVAEASALATVGRNARLFGRRIATPTVTCALAIGEGP